MKFEIRELEIIERLLTNRLNADFNDEVDALLHKVKRDKQYKLSNQQSNRME